MKKKIILIRHAESIGNAGGTTPTTDSNGLSELGKTQAQELTRKISTAPDLIAVSKYIRTQETAQPLQEQFPHVPVVIWSIQEFTYLNGSKYHNTTQADRRVPREEYWKRCEPGYCDGDNAESFQNFFRRIKQFIQNSRAHPASSIIVFSHELFILGMTFIIENKINVNGIGPKIMAAFRDQFYGGKRIPNAIPIDFTKQILQY